MDLPDACEDADVANVCDRMCCDGAVWSSYEVQLDDDVTQRIHIPIYMGEVLPLLLTQNRKRGFT